MPGRSCPLKNNFIVPCCQSDAGPSLQLVAGPFCSIPNRATQAKHLTNISFYRSKSDFQYHHDAKRLLLTTIARPNRQSSFSSPDQNYPQRCPSSPPDCPGSVEGHQWSSCWPPILTHDLLPRSAGSATAAFHRAHSAGTQRCCSEGAATDESNVFSWYAATCCFMLLNMFLPSSTFNEEANLATVKKVSVCLQMICYQNGLNSNQ